MTGNGNVLDRDLVSLLSGMGCSLSSGAASFILDAINEEVEPALFRLREQGLVHLSQAHQYGGWAASEGAASLPDADTLENWRGKLAEYVLLSPGAALDEIIAALGWNRLPARDRAALLLSALREAGGSGEFSLLARFIMEIMELEDLGERETEEVLRAFQPRRLRGCSLERAERFLLDVLPVLRAPAVRILALARLGEIELVQNRSAVAEEHLREALELSMALECGEYIPPLLESLGELPRDFQAMTEMSSEVDRVLRWVSGIDDADVQARVTASAAVAQAGLRMNAVAERTILLAMTRISSLPLETQMTVEWCRARVYMSSGRRKAAMSMLQRALMLAERVNDQLAVMEILNTLVNEMKERPGYTVRALITIMRDVSRKAGASGNRSNRTYALDRLTDMYTRTLQFSAALDAARESGDAAGTFRMLRDESLSRWCIAYIGFLTEGEPGPEGGEGLLPGTAGFLGALADDREPVTEAGTIAEFLLASPAGDVFVYALILALEAFARGKRKASSIVAAALDSVCSSSPEDPVMSWKLCISGMLASRDLYSEDFFQSAGLLARQLDRLLLVWLLIRCRLSLELDRSERDQGRLLLLGSELDIFVLDQLDRGRAGNFRERGGASARMEELLRMTGVQKGTGLCGLRDILHRSTAGDMEGRIFEIGGLSSQISGRSEISASLEILGRLLNADRVLALGMTGDGMEIIEGYGSGRWRLPGDEIRDVVIRKPAVNLWVDQFSVTPFGSRRCLFIPLEGSFKDAQKRSLIPDRSPGDNCLLVEVDSPFPEEDVPAFIIQSLSGQVDAALQLRSRESMAYMDRLTGAVIGFSWTSRLEDLMAVEDPEHPLSVLIIGVDRLREVNRLFGYRAGDSVLRTLVITVSSVLRPNDITGRIRGDVFGVALPDTSGKDARAVAERICGAVAGVDMRPDRVPVTVSIGAAVAGPSREGHDLVVSRASEAMRAAGAGGGNRALLWSEDIALPDDRPMKLFNTGDPGWDHSVCSAVMELLLEREPTLEFLSGKLRDALRSQLVYIEDGRGGDAFAGSRVLSGISSETGDAREGTVTLHCSLLGKYDALSAGLPGGGRVISAWETSGGVPLSVRNVFAALSGLSGLIVSRMD